MTDDPECTCGDPKSAHTAKTLLRNDACAYAHDSDAPCWCYRYTPASRGFLLKPDGTAMTISMGKLNDEQEAVVRQYVAGYNVHDLGAGQLGMAQKLIELGAHTVTAIDKIYSYSRPPWSPPPGVTLVGEYFEEYARHGHFVDVALVSWPEAYNSPQAGIVTLLKEARIVIYLGSNFDGTACGSEEMFRFLSQREVLALVPNKFNSLIVYGRELVHRRLLPEEYAALNRDKAYCVYGAEIEELQELPALQRRPFHNR